MATPAHALSTPLIPILTLNHTISSHPWPTGTLTSVNANDIEGLISVPSDNSIWVADDNRDRIYEIDATTGGLKSQILASAFQTTGTQVGSGQLCSDPLQLDPSITGDTAASECLSRTDDFESIVYDPGTTPGVNDVLYLTSGGCCTAGLPAGYPKHPTVWALTRSGGHFAPSQWQALPETEDPTAAGWRPGTGMYYGKNNFVRTYDFASNALGSKITAPTYLVGIDFTDASNVFLTTATPNPTTGRTTATSDSTITKYTFSGSSFTAVPGWSFPLQNTGMIDARDLTLVNDTFYVSDGYDFRTGSELNSTGVAGDHPIYVYTLGSAPAPTASFTAIPSIGRAPFTVQFTDTSTPLAPAIGAASSWAWDFDGNGTTDSTLQNPLPHQYATPGTYTAKLTATNAAGFTSATQQITVKAATNLPGGYIVDGWGGLQRFKVGTGTLPPKTSGGAYWPGWDIARGVGILPTGTGGYTLDGWGGLQPFRIGGGANPPAVSGAPYWTGWDIARGVAILPNGTGGYEVDAYGGTHPFAIGANSAPPAAIGIPYWSGQDMARGISITPNGKGGFVSDRTGKLWPFKIGSGGTAPATPNGVSIITATSVQGVSIMFDGTGGYTVDGWGGAHPFGIGISAPPPATSGGPYWPGWDIARDIATMPDV